MQRRHKHRKIVVIIDTAFREFPWAVESIFWQ
jgi:hypothetical protein